MVEPLPLVRDVLDKQIYDVNHEKVGKVDGIVLIPRQGRPLRIAVLQSDMPTAWRRVWERLGDWVEQLQQKLAPDLANPTRIAFEHVVRASWGDRDDTARHPSKGQRPGDPHAMPAPLGPSSSA